jgi:NAD(P)-dependent dehydrogenase (short-subunit alcohol dehydrogenase family)
MLEKIALVTGGSSGIGEATAVELVRLGYTVYAGARRLERMEGLRAQGVRTLSLDVTDEGSLRAAVSTIEKEAGRIDVLVNNAGYGSYGSVEEVTLEEGRRQFDVNLFGAMRLTQLVIPVMRRQKSGWIINISSIGGKIYTPFGAWYHGTKFALEGMSDVLRAELKPFGIGVVVIEPGAIRTEWSGIASDSVLQTSGNGPYAEAAKKLAASLTTGPFQDRASDPWVIAKTISTAVTARTPKARYAAGFGARGALLARRLLSDRSFDKLMSRMIS